MDDSIVRDRRPSGHLPREEDYATPVTRTTLTAANKRFRETGVQLRTGWDQQEADRIIRRAAKDRFTSRHRGGDDLPSIGEYLEYLNTRGRGLPGQGN